MFDIRKVQEKVMYEAVRAKSNADVAGEVVYGCVWKINLNQRMSKKYEWIVNAVTE